MLRLRPLREPLFKNPTPAKQWYIIFNNIYCCCYIYPMNKDSDMFPDRTDSRIISSSKLSRNSLSETAAQPRPHPADVNKAINPLVAAAAELLTIASQLSELKQTPNLKELQARIVQELTQFENRSHANHYSSQMILAARYLLCSYIDEMVLTSQWGKQSFWVQQNLVGLYQPEAKSGEHFFTILERSADDPQLYIDVLELGYICLSMGFEGQYRDKDKRELIIFIDNLSELIHRIRGEFPSSLFIASTTIKHKKRRLRLLPPVWLTTIIAIIVLIFIFLPYYQELENISHHLQTLITPTTTSTSETS